jgi:tryptophan synthase alpha chain
MLFRQLKNFRQEITVPVILMGYMNPVLQYGFEKFCRDAAMAGIDGLILPDLPEYEFENLYGDIVKKQGLDFIFLVTPETSAERVKKLDSLSSGFLYAVSSSSTTGSNQFPANLENYLEKLKTMNLKNPVLVGFGIRDRQSFEQACKLANGAIIGSAFIKAISGSADLERQTHRFLSAIRT